MEKKEPTNQVLLESMNVRFNMVFEQLRRHDGLFVLISQQLGVLLRTQKELGEEIHEIKETVNVMAKAVDADALTVIEHGKRITRLENKTA